MDYSRKISERLWNLPDKGDYVDNSIQKGRECDF